MHCSSHDLIDTLLEQQNNKMSDTEEMINSHHQNKEISDKKMKAAKSSADNELEQIHNLVNAQDLDKYFDIFDDL